MNWDFDEIFALFFLFIYLSWAIIPSNPTYILWSKLGLNPSRDVCSLRSRIFYSHSKGRGNAFSRMSWQKLRSTSPYNRALLPLSSVRLFLSFTKCPTCGRKGYYKTVPTLMNKRGRNINNLSFPKKQSQNRSNTLSGHKCIFLPFFL